MFTNLYPPVFSGSSTQCAQLAEELARQGCKVVVITSRVDPESLSFEEHNGVTIYRLPCLRLPRLPIALNFPWLNFTFTMQNWKRVLEILREEGVDVLHVHNHMFDMAFHAVRAARLLKKPLALTIHTIIRHPHRFHDFILRLLDRTFLRRLIVRNADMVICPDSIIEAYAVQTLGARGTVLIPYGIHPPPEADPHRMMMLRKKLDAGEGPVIVSLGHLHEVRNRRELIMVLPCLLKTFPNLKVVIVGDVGTRSAHQLAEKLGVLKHLIFCGAVPHAEIQDYLGIADLEAHWFDRSHPHRALGIAAQEAMAAGMAVIGDADETIYGEGVLRNGENVILVDPADVEALTHQITQVLENDTKSRQIGENARATIQKHFAWNLIGGQTISAYLAIQKTE
jgi:glycosyltransferase involved in cell wall biosynthesis